LTFISCKKVENQEQLTVQTNIAITSPHENQAYNKGDTVLINGKINAPAHIHGYKVLILKNSVDTVFSKEEHIHGMEVNILQTWVNDLSVTADLQLVVIATLDHDGNTANKKVIFKNITD
jgi:hypothetical protein